MKWLCLIGIHKWLSLGSRGLVLPSFIEQCDRCGCGREVMFTGTLTYTPEQMADISALNPGGSRDGNR